MVRAFVVLLLVCSTTALAGDLPRFAGMYQTNNQPLPMLESKLDVTVRGPIIEVIVTQRFQNRDDRATEATYIFPLPPDAAVSAMWIKSGNKTIHAKIAKREEAQQAYEEAVRAGVVAGVLDQERPDIFTQTVAGIPPKGTIEVSIRYDALAHFYDNAWGAAFPMVVAPRYVAGTATSRPTTGTGRAPDTDRAPDASRVTPGGSPGAGGSTAVTINFADKVSDVTSPTHELTVSGQKATFVDPKSDHDAIIRWKMASAAGWVEQGPGGGFAAVVVEAPAPTLTRKTSMRCLLVLDRSATSRGDADALAQPLVRQFLSSLDANDRISVTGSDTLGWQSPSVIQRALDQSWTQKTGPFDLTKVLQAARPEGAPIVLVTGGLVADDRAAIAAAKKLGVPVHVIGVGPAPARALLMQIATTTGGTARFAQPGDDLPMLARAVIADTTTPITPLTVTWGTLSASDVVPGTLPRLGAGQAVLVLARVKKAQTANGRAGGELFAIDVATSKPIEGAIANVGPLGRRWARSRIEEMIALGKDAGSITKLALEFGLVSPYTSMVAIGDEVTVQGGTRRSIAVPVSVPSGMKWQAVKKETTVDVTGVAPTIDQTTTVSGTTITTDKKPVVKGNKPPHERPQPTKKDASKDEEEEKPKKKQPRRDFGDQNAPTQPVPGAAAGRARVDVGEDDDERVDGEDAISKSPKNEPAPADVALEGGYGGEETLVERTIAKEGLLGRRIRLSLSFAGGFAHSQGENVALLAGGLRLEVGVGANLFGADVALFALRGGDYEGHALLSYARGFKTYLELGLGAGAQFGQGVGPAGSLSLRVHVPPAPRAAGYLRYDGAYVRDAEADVSRGQHTFTLGVEWGF